MSKLIALDLSMSNSQFMRRKGSDTGLDNVSAIGRNRSAMGTKMRPSDPASARSIRSAISI